MNKKFIIAGVIAIVLIFITLILIVVFTHAPGQGSIVMNNIEVSNTTNTVENVVENKVGVNGLKVEKGEIEYYDLEEGGTIPIPPTFKYVEGEIDTGAVIEDKYKNQFVWVPIERYEQDYTRFLFDRNGDYDNKELEENLLESADYNTDYDDSVRNYGGFYVARYEAGKEGDNLPAVSKDGVMPWTGVSWQRAKDLAFGMYEENDYFQSDLINSYAWDSICQWFRKDESFSVDDSVNYGNYQNGKYGYNVLLESGSNREWVNNNSYDMAGNAWELTTEYEQLLISGDLEVIHIGRGGGYWNNGDEYPISSRTLTDNDGANIAVGFRVVLYLK